MTVLDALGPEMSNKVLWVGGEGGIEATLVPRADIPFREIPAAGVHGVGLRTLPGNLMKLFRGYLQARQVIREFQPEAMLFTGGYVAIPVALAGPRVPKLLYVPDIEPGLALITLARLANQIAVTAEEAIAYFVDRTKVVVTGYPTRKSLQEWTQDAALDFFQLDDRKPVLLVFGGSKGARSINRALVTALPDLLEKMQIIHITGRLDWQEVNDARSDLPQNLLQNYRVYEYLHDQMGAALRIADLVVSRAGAATLGEYPLFGVPAILVPYPYAWRYQKVNADYLVSNGAAVLLKDEKLETDLSKLVKELMANENKREGMAVAMRSLHKPNASEKIANLLVSLAEASQKGK